MARTRSIFSLFIIIALLLAGCGRRGAAQPQKKTQAAAQATSAGQPAALTHVRLPMGYIPSVQFAPFYVAIDKGYFKQAGIEIEFDYKYETDGVALVGANQLQFAVVSGEQVLLARAQGVPVIYVLAWWQDYPVAVVAKSDQNIRKPADLAGKKIGLPGPFGASYIGLRALLSAGGLKESDVTLDSIGYNQVESLVGSQDQAVVVYVNNEPIQLRARGYDVSVLRVADFMQLASNGLITNETTLAQNPALVRGMNQAILRGVADTIADPDGAYEISKKHVEGLDKADEGIQKQILTTSIEFWKTGQPGLSKPEAWQNMQKVLLDMGLLKTPLDLNKAFTNDYVK